MSSRNMSTPVLTKTPPVQAESNSLHIRSIANTLAPLEKIAAHSTSLIANYEARFESNGQTYELPRYIFIGPRGGDSPIRLGIFAAINGDEPEGAYGLVRFAQALEQHPELARGFILSLYPICNPTGFEDNTRRSRQGKDLNAGFWKESAAPEVRLLEAEIRLRAFHGLITLRSDEAGEGFYGSVRGATLTKHLIEPALAAAELFLPRDARTNFGGRAAQNGVIRDDSEGMLSAPPKARPRPFEMTLTVAKPAPVYLKECAFIAALQTILAEYRKFIAYAPNL